MLLKVLHGPDAPDASVVPHSVYGDVTSCTFYHQPDGSGMARLYVREPIKTAECGGFVEVEKNVDIPTIAFLMNDNGKTVSTFAATMEARERAWLGTQRGSSGAGSQRGEYTGPIRPGDYFVWYEGAHPIGLCRILERGSELRLLTVGMRYESFGLGYTWSDEFENFRRRVTPAVPADGLNPYEGEFSRNIELWISLTTSPNVGTVLSAEPLLKYEGSERAAPDHLPPYTAVVVQMDSEKGDYFQGEKWAFLKEDLRNLCVEAL